MRGLAAVEPEREFVQISLQVSFFKGALVRSQQPALSQSCDTVYAWQNLVGFFAGALDGRSLVDVGVFCTTRIRCPSVGVDGRARVDVLLHKRLECFGFGVGDNLQAASPQPLWGESFHSDSHQHLASRAAPALAVPYASEYGLIHFHRPGQQIMPGMADCASESVQHGPCRRVGAKAKDSMERFSGNTVFSGCQMPGGRKPDRQWRSGVVKDRAGCGGDTTDARFAPPSSAFHAPGRDASTVRANKSVSPSNPIKVVKAGSILRKPRQKLGVVARVIDPGSGGLRSHLRYR